MVIVNEIHPPEAVQRFAKHSDKEREHGGLVIINVVVSDGSVHSAEIALFNVEHTLFGDGLNGGKAS